MPQRFLRPGLRNSKRWNRLSWIAQSFYVRLITLVDDFGRYEGDCELLRGECFPFDDPAGKKIQMQTIDNICSQMIASNLVVFYSVEGRDYLQLTRWKDNPRTEKSKYPDPYDQSANICKQLLSVDSKCSLPSSSSSSSSSSSPETCGAVSGKAVSGFKIPTLDQIKLLMAKAGLPESEAERFFNFYSSNGWRVGRNPMRSTPHAVGHWKSNYEERNYINRNTSKTAPSNERNRFIAGHGDGNHERALALNGLLPPEHWAARELAESAEIKDAVAAKVAESGGHKK